MGAGAGVGVVPAPALPLSTACPDMGFRLLPGARDDKACGSCLGFVDGKAEEDDEEEGATASRAGLAEVAPGKSCLAFGFGGT